jgi:plastocyanin
VTCSRGSIAGATLVTAGTADTDTFMPSSVSITAGQSVTWTESTGAHTTTSDTSGLWNYNFRGANDQYSCTFNMPGTYSYHCIPHQSLGMTGTVTVTGGAARPSSPLPATTPAGYRPSFADQMLEVDRRLAVAEVGCGCCCCC